MVNYSDIKVGDILYRYEKNECSEGWEVFASRVDKVIDIKTNPYPQYKAFIYFKNSDSETIYQNQEKIENLFHTEKELIKHLQSVFKKQLLELQ